MRRIALLGAIVFLTAGCGGPKLVPVKGRVVFADGRPVTAASVFFSPDTAKENNGALSASSLLQEDGSFTLRTYPHGNGAMVGSYRVTVSLGFGATPQLVKYTRLKDTPLKVDVPPEGRADLVLTLE